MVTQSPAVSGSSTREAATRAAALWSLRVARPQAAPSQRVRGYRSVRRWPSVSDTRTAPTCSHGDPWPWTCSVNLAPNRDHEHVCWWTWRTGTTQNILCATWFNPPRVIQCSSENKSISQPEVWGWQSWWIHTKKKKEKEKEKSTCYLVYHFPQSENSPHKGVIEQGETGAIVSQRLLSPSQRLHLPSQIPLQHSAEVKWNAVGEEHWQLFDRCQPLSISPPPSPPGKAFQILYHIPWTYWGQRVGCCYSYGFTGSYKWKLGDTHSASWRRMHQSATWQQLNA